jgi:hypothetical protein
MQILRKFKQLNFSNKKEPIKGLKCDLIKEETTEYVLRLIMSTSKTISGRMSKRTTTVVLPIAILYGLRFFRQSKVVLIQV